MPEEGLPEYAVEPAWAGWTHAGGAEEESRETAAESEEALAGSTGRADADAQFPGDDLP